MPYAGSKAQVGLGTVLSLKVATVYTEVGELKDNIGQSGRKVGTEETTNFDSSSEEFLGTLPSSGSWAITGNRVGGDAGQSAMEAAYNTAGVLQEFKIQLPKTGVQVTNGDSFTFKAIVEELNYSIGLKKTVTFAATLKVSGSITIVAGA